MSFMRSLMLFIQRYVKQLAIVVIAFVVMIGVAGCSTGQSQNNASGDHKNLRKVSFMMSWSPDTNHIGIYVAKKLGYFAKQGLDVDILATSQAGAEQSVSTGVADFAMSNLANVAAYDANGAKLKFIFDVQQKPSAIWCSLANRDDIHTPKDFDGKTFASFGTLAESAVIKQMIKHAGGKGDIKTVTVGTSTFQVLSSGKGDFGGFYDTWEGVQSRLYGPKLKCFKAPDWGVPGNADQIGLITADKTVEHDPKLVQAFVTAAQQGYKYAYEHPKEAGEILVKGAPEANLKQKFVDTSMDLIVKEQYWGNRKDIEDGKFALGTTNFKEAQDYINFLYKAGVYVNSENKPVKDKPIATQIATNEFVH